VAERTFASMDPQRQRELADPSNAAFEDAMRQTWEMVDPFNPPPPGSYARGSHEGICAALKTMRENYDRERLKRASAAPSQDSLQLREHAGHAAAWKTLHDEAIPSSNRYVRAIKAHREACGSSLKAAKEAVDDIKSGRIRPPFNGDQQ
jgi:hypothetical protein